MTETIHIPQDKETPLTTHKTPFGSVMALYNRSNDSVDAGTIGQDYATFRFSADDLAFAVCDGVGQSFMGDLAARVLGDGIIEWLWNLEEAPTDADAFSKQAEGALAALTEKGAQIVKEYELPEALPPIVKQALEMQRAYGSESMFVAARIALMKNFIVVAWLGDSPVAAIDVDGELVDLGPHGSTSERWNATTGVKGNVHTWVGTADQVARVAGYTDGLAVASVPTDADLAKMVEAWRDNPPSDDASLIDVRLAPSRATIGHDDPDGLDKVESIKIESIKIEPIKIEVPASPVEDAEPRPIPIQPERNPVKGVAPIDDDDKIKPPEPVQKGPPRAIAPQVKRDSILGDKPDHKRSAEEDGKLQQIRAWQQAARDKLIGAKLALDQIERLLGDDKAD